MKVRLMFGNKSHVTLSLDPAQFDTLTRFMVVLSGNTNTEVLHRLTAIHRLLEEIKTMDQATQDLLTKIDAATTQIGTNVAVIATNTQTIATVDQTISDELDVLIAAAAAAGNTPADVLAALQTKADALQTNADAATAAAAALQAQVPVLQGIAAKGQPVVPEPPPAPTA